MNREKHHRILRRAVRHLADYQPEDAHWAKLENALDHAGKKGVLEQLPQFQPSDLIWEKIDERLQRSEKSGTKKSSLVPLWISITAAAMIALFLLVFDPFQRASSKLTYREEWIPAGTVDMKWPQNDSVLYRQISQTCKLKPQICSSDEFSKLKQELEFLDDSKQTIINQLNKYDTDRDLDNMLSRIETERTDLLNQMKNLIN